MKIILKRNLRRSVLRGHPWIYKEALQLAGSMVSKPILAELLDSKKKFLAWVIYDPYSVLAVRVISTEKRRPDSIHFSKVFDRAQNLRSSLDFEKTNCYRLWNGEGDLLPGLVCDVYKDVAILQFDGRGPSEFWERSLMVNWLRSNLDLCAIVEKSRGDSKNKTVTLWGDFDEKPVKVIENGIQFVVDLVSGQKTGFFLDQRDNREYLRSRCEDKEVLNLFSYTGGFSVYAGVGGAKFVTSMDISQGALDLATESWHQNNLPRGRHKSEKQDIYQFLSESREKWDLIVVDPPSMAHSEKKRSIAIQKYTELFVQALKRVRDCGEICFSSCSSHVTFEDFHEIIVEALSQSRRTASYLKISGQGIDHPFPHACMEMRYLKFIHLQLRN